jgi:tryptophanyl-tRNA synthetase
MLIEGVPARIASATSERKRILTGIRPSGSLHLGHYAGALENWVKLQSEYDCYFLIADYQVSDYANDLPRVRNAVWEVALDWLAMGLEPETGSFVIDSLVPEHTELTTWFAWLLPVGRFEHNPTLKAEMEGIEELLDGKTKEKSASIAFYIYPVMQVANILLPRANLCLWERTPIQVRGVGGLIHSATSDRRCLITTHCQSPALVMTGLFELLGAGGRRHQTCRPPA